MPGRLMHPVLQPLQTLLGDKGFIAGDQAEEFTTDVAGKTASCLAVLRPGSTPEVAEIVTLCAEHGVAIIPQGGNTNVCGMTLAEPVAGSSGMPALGSYMRVRKSASAPRA